MTSTSFPIAEVHEVQIVPRGSVFNDVRVWPRLHLLNVTHYEWVDKQTSRTKLRLYHTTLKAEGYFVDLMKHVEKRLKELDPAFWENYANETFTEEDEADASADRALVARVKEELLNPARFVLAQETEVKEDRESSQEKRQSDAREGRHRKRRCAECGR